jgi:hypothetical protein
MLSPQRKVIASHEILNEIVRTREPGCFVLVLIHLSVPIECDRSEIIGGEHPVPREELSANVLCDCQLRGVGEDAAVSPPFRISRSPIGVDLEVLAPAPERLDRDVVLAGDGREFAIL